MNGIEFGEYLKKIRTKEGKASKELSKEIGKAVTYVSQLERGLIKSPDYEACYNLLLVLGIEKEKIDSILRNFGIKSPEQVEEELNLYIQEYDDEFDWMERETYKLKEINTKLYNIFNLFIDKDFTRAEQLLSNIYYLTGDRQTFDFLYQIFKFNYTHIDLEDRKELINLINDYIFSKYKLDEWDDLVRKDDK